MIRMRDVYGEYESATGIPRCNRILIPMILKSLEPLWKILKFKRPRIGLIRDDRDMAATYFAESAPAPIILLDAESHFSLERSLQLHAIISSITHELGHAALEMRGFSCDTHNEEWVEDLARRYTDLEITPLQFLKEIYSYSEED